MMCAYGAWLKDKMRYDDIDFKYKEMLFVIPVVTVEQMREFEAAADKNGVTYEMMMENAGRAAAERALQIIENLPNPRITILVGKGNNGGDGLVVRTARHGLERAPPGVEQAPDAGRGFQLPQARERESEEDGAQGADDGQGGEGLPGRWPACART